jgi:hypothetical protein
MGETGMRRIDGLRGSRYGEVILVRADGQRFEAEVWSTMGFSDCPPDEFTALDDHAIAAERGALFALKNGPRRWALDAIEAGMGAAAPTTTFGMLEMFRVATIDFGSTPPSSDPYTERAVARDTVFEWAADAARHELTAPDGRRYVMQSLAEHVDPGQTLASVGGSGERLALPLGWAFTTRTEDQPLWLLSSSAGVAAVVQDELANTYQRVDRTG